MVQLAFFHQKLVCQVQALVLVLEIGLGLIIPWQMKGVHFSKEIMQLVLANEVILQRQGITDQAATHKTLVEDDVVVVVVQQVGQVPTSLIETS